MYLVPGATKASSRIDASAGGAPEQEDTGTPLHPPPPPTAMRDADPPSEAAVLDHYSTCETDRYPETPQPLGIYLIVDQSKSIEPEWSTVVNTLEGFIDESQTLLNVDIGIQYFALTPNLTTPSSTWSTSACMATSYDVPDVGISAVASNHDALFASLVAHGPDAIAAVLAQNPSVSLPASPIDIALSGAIQGARDWATRNAGANPRPVVLLVSAGIDNTASPPVCDQPQLGAIIAAASGVAGIPSVATYVLAIGDKPDMDQIAFAGGTGSAHAVPTDPTHSDILSTLEEIRTSALPCEVDVDASALKNRRVNVELSGTSLTRVQSSAACDLTTGSLEWYVSIGDGGASHIELCPTTCQTVRGTSEGTLEVVYGCRTQQAQ